MIRVMVAEDDPMVMEITCKYVDSIPNFKVYERVSSGHEALEKLALISVDLLVLDIYMPIMNGVELLARLRGEGSMVDALFLTADNNTAVINNALKLGAVDYLIKPFSYERFKAALGNFERRYRLLHEGCATTQHELDIMLGQCGGEIVQIQKGIHPKTLENIRRCIASGSGGVIYQDDITSCLSLSKVTVRRYMEYLASINEVVLQVEYGSVGRPVYTYRKL